ncbi:hypothetical protein GCM10018783_73640 [Streptomyces griseosporeus]|nr:hypothetical protein GCM10018783_73640 [Streptomyces griseosporeus]
MITPPKGEDKKLPPFMQGRKAPNEDVRKAKSDAARRRIQMIAQKKTGK